VRFKLYKGFFGDIALGLLILRSFVFLKGARSQDTNPWQTQVMARGVSRSSGIFLWIWSYIFGIQRLSV